MLGHCAATTPKLEVLRELIAMPAEMAFGSVNSTAPNVAQFEPSVEYRPAT
jgi:hypothetical protein